jgi:hypothetical protein
VPACASGLLGALAPGDEFHYESGVEQQRLVTWRRLEFIRTTEILGRYLPAPPGVIADAGGGPGASRQLYG